MRLPLLISLSLLLLPRQNAGAQLAPADSFFNSGAQSYISNNIPLAKAKVEMGLQLYPDDEKLKKLEELLKQQQQSQSSQSQPNQDQQNQSQPQQNNQPDQQQKSEGQKDQPSKDQQSQKPEDQQKSQQPEQQSAQSSPDQKSGENDKKESADPMTAHALTPQEAKSLLDAQKGNEQTLVLKPQGKPENQNRPPLKDW